MNWVFYYPRSAFLERTAPNDAEKAAEARELKDRALETHGKQLASETYALPPLEGESTSPGTPR